MSRTIGVAIDIGNSSMHLRRFSSDQNTPLENRSLDKESSSDDAKFFAAEPSRRFGDRDADREVIASAIELLHAWRSDQPLRLFVASVNEPVFRTLKETCDQYQNLVSHWYTLARKQVPLQLDIDEHAVEYVGIDRILACYAAAIRSDGTAVVVDSGSAITVDIALNNRFLGGIIMPGLGMQTRILAGGTDRLSEIDFDTLSMPVPAKNTTDAIRSGILAGVVSGIDFAIDRYQSLAAENGKSNIAIWGTGGDISWVHPLLNREFMIRSNLVCDAIVDLSGTIDDVFAQGER